MEKGRYDKIMGLLYDPRFFSLLPGEISHAGTDESVYADLLLQDKASDVDEKSMVRLDARIKIKEQRMKSLRLQLARMISPTVTQVQLEKTKPTSFPLDKYAGVATQTEWRTIVISWIKQPSWHGHRRASFAMAAKAACKSPGTWRAYESRTHVMKATSIVPRSSA